MTTNNFLAGPGLGARLVDSLNYFLVEISGKIQLSKTHIEKVEGHYQAIAEVLQNSPAHTLLNKLDVKMLPYGGLGSGTASKPYQGDEFDLDVAVRFLSSIRRFGGAQALYDEVFSRLYSLESYRDKLEKKDRTIRVYYAGDFYLELMPALPDDITERATKALWVPEWEGDSCSLVRVDPLGLNEWFETRCSRQMRVDKAMLNERGDFEVMPLPTPEARKPMLKQAVGLIKRARDVYFRNDPECKKILKSVVIQTVAGNLYNGETDLYSFILAVVDAIDNETRELSLAKVTNPINHVEDFLAPLRRHPDRHSKLRRFIGVMGAKWSALAEPGKSMLDRKELLSGIFGETVTSGVLREYGDRMADLNRNGNMRMSASGVLGSSVAAVGRVVPRHQFYGEK